MSRLPGILGAAEHRLRGQGAPCGLDHHPVVDSDDDDDLLTDDQLLHLAKYQPESLTKSQLLTVVRILKPTAQSSDESDDVSETQTADDAESQSVDVDDRPDAVTQTDTEPQSPDGRRSETQSDDRQSGTLSVRDVMQEPDLDTYYGPVMRWGDRDSDDEIRWSDVDADDVRISDDDAATGRHDDESTAAQRCMAICGGKLRLTKSQLRPHGRVGSLWVRGPDVHRRVVGRDEPAHPALMGRLEIINGEGVWSFS